MRIRIRNKFTIISKFEQKSNIFFLNYIKILCILMWVSERRRKKPCIYIFDFGLTKRDSTGIYKTSFVNNLLVHVTRYSGLVSFFNLFVFVVMCTLLYLCGLFPFNSKFQAYSDQIKKVNICYSFLGESTLPNSLAKWR